MPTVYTSNGSGTVAANPPPPPSGGLPNAPTWITDIPAGHWAAASLNNLMSIATGPGDFAGIFQNYNGAARVPPGSTAYPDGAVLFHGGGHEAAGQNNSLVAFNVTTRLFELVEPPTTTGINSGGAGTYPDSSYPDGKPVPTHTYFYPGFDEENEYFYNPRGVTSYTASTQEAQTSQGFFFDLAASSWRRGPRNNGFDALYKNGGRTVWDPRRGCFWTMTCDTSVTARLIVRAENLNVQNGDGTYGILTNYNYNDSLGTESDAVFVLGDTPNDDLIIYSRFPASGSRRLHAVRFNNNIPQPRVDLLINGNFPASLSRKAALMWSERRNSLIYYDNKQPIPATGGFPSTVGYGRAIVWEVQAPPNKLTGTWTWNIITANTNTYIPSSALETEGDEIYSKARLLKYNDAEVIIAGTAHNAPASAFRIP